MARGSSSEESSSPPTSSDNDELMLEPKTKTIEQRYTKMTQLQHILARPDTYVGAISPETAQTWVWDDDEKAIVQRTVTYVPALYKIYDEIIVNAADVKARELYEGASIPKSKSMTKIDITIDPQAGSISVLNDGSCIPIEIHKEHQVYVPELIFGHLLTSDNYDDTESRVTGGRNGYGAKLTNVFSTKFTVECTDSKRKRKFKMVWTKNMSEHTEADISTLRETGPDYVRVTFWPDFKRLNTPDGLNKDVYSLLKKRAYDLAGTVPNISVVLNGERLSGVSNFKNYVDLYFPGTAKISSENSPPTKQEDSSGSSPPLIKATKIYERLNKMWEVVICESNTGNFQQVSFVNSICTSKGGTHISLIVDPIVDSLLKKVNTKNKGGFQMKASHIKNHLFVFVNCRVVNPTFDSQTKEWMSLRSLTKVAVSDKTISLILKSDIMSNILLWAQTKEQVELQKLMKGGHSGGRERIIGIPKLEDANDAGTSRSHECTLILTEGDSAKTSCIAGLSVVGKDKYGVFPLRGKLLNVRDASFSSLSENKEIQNIMKITGLQISQKTPKLRYGSIMIMTDQDLDGSHIKGLLINFIQYYWPSLLKENSGFLKQFITPIIKATRKKEVLSFFTMQEFHRWKLQQPDLDTWSIKYYKGLGTSGDKEFIDYFKNLRRHTLEFKFDNDEDFEAIDMAFNAKRAEDRKRWISSFSDEHSINYNEDIGVNITTTRKLRYLDFINKDLVQFSRYDLQRSIPSLVDGLKPAQRKALFGALKKGLWSKEMKVAQLAAYISDVSCYHHGEDSMAATIVNMAQRFVGASNINLFDPRGQFGSRKEGGKDASATRYIYTRLTKVAKAIFKAEDAPILWYKNDEGKSIEPDYYVPTIPLILVNGSEGIGTGWSSSIPNYNPKDIIENIRRFLKGQDMIRMKPWYRGFIGEIVENGKGGFESCGILEKIEDGVFFIAELPIKVWTQSYKEWLEELLAISVGADTSHATAKTKAKAKAKGKARAKAAATTRTPKFCIQDYRDNSTHDSIAFTINLTPEQEAAALAVGDLDKAFRLRKTITTSNMVLFDAKGMIKKYADELEIIKEFCDVRLEFYVKRKAYQTVNLERELCLVSNKLKFVLEIINNSLQISNKRKAELEAELQRRGYHTMEYVDKTFDTTNPTLQAEVSQDGAIRVAEETLDDSNMESSTVTTRGQYDYLLSMQLYTLTKEKVDALRKQREDKEHELEDYRRKTPQQLWLDDLDELETVLAVEELIESDDRAEAERARRIAQGMAVPARPMKTAPKRRAAAPKKTTKKAAVKMSEEDDDEELFKKVKLATMTANDKLIKPTTTTSSSSNEFDFMEGMRAKIASNTSVSGLSATLQSNPPIPPAPTKITTAPAAVSKSSKRTNPDTASAPIKERKRAKVKSDEEEEDEELFSDGISLVDDDDEEEEEEADMEDDDDDDDDVEVDDDDEGESETDFAD